MPAFTHHGYHLAYSEFGDPSSPRTTILVHGLLMNRKMHAPLARALTAQGNRAITLDLLGHGESDRPVDMWRYGMGFFAEQIVALMDHLELEQSVVLGTSLGANSALEVASSRPERLRGMVIEMPVLDNALLACAIGFTPLLVATTFGAPLTRLVARGFASLPRRGVPLWGEVMLDALSNPPAPAAAILQGLFFGRTAPHRAERRTFETPALVIGHHRDPIHAFSDAGMLADELPRGRLLEATSIIELRLAPARLTAEIAGFIDDCWQPRESPRQAPAGASA
ncbi:MAG: alpha/beta fold hydrolase [Solirubrobacteraceae bacterium]